jgi:hypothetical protein
MLLCSVVTIMLNVFMLNVMVLSMNGTQHNNKKPELEIAVPEQDAECKYAECRYAGCSYEECLNAECRYEECLNAERRYEECHNAEALYEDCHNVKCRHSDCRDAKFFPNSLFNIFYLEFFSLQTFDQFVIEKCPQPKLILFQ